jgi:hypothetical protein
MPANYLTNLNDILVASRCSLNCLKEEERLAMDLYLRALELAGNVGQPNYTGAAGLAQLLQDAKAWNSQVLNCATRDAVSFFLDYQNAISVNPATPVGAGAFNTIKAASTCFSCLPWETKKNLALYLKWRLNTLAEPE